MFLIDLLYGRSYVLNFLFRQMAGRRKIKTFILRNKKNSVTFSELLPSDSKDDKIYTFVPLLHLTTQRKIDLHQEKHFGEIDIMLNQGKKQVEGELGDN